jgi:hypothetical protein
MPHIFFIEVLGGEARGLAKTGHRDSLQLFYSFAGVFGPWFEQKLSTGVNLSLLPLYNWF